MHWSNDYWGMHMFGWIVMLIAIGLVLLWARSRPAKPRDSAIEELRRTYASGQISEDEYRHRLAVLTEGRPDEHTPSAA
jgi:uncharacterized membrane protein